MSESELALDESIKHYWLAGRGFADAERVIVQALASPPESAKRAARALQIMDAHEAELSPALQKRIEQFRPHVARLRERIAQIDAIGNVNTEPDAALFEVLGAATEAVELPDFDEDALRKARAGAASRADAADALLGTFGYDHLGVDLARELRAAIDEIRREQQHHRSHALFVDSGGKGFALGVVADRAEGGTFSTPTAVAEDMRRQAEVALRQVMPEGATWNIEWPLDYEGESIGLGLIHAALVATGQLEPDALVAATGKVEVDGRVHAVGGIAEKLRAAETQGIRRVALPFENRTGAEAFSGDIELVFVERVSELRSKLLQASSVGAEMSFHGRIRLARSLLRAHGLELEDELSIQNGYRLIVGNAAGSAKIDIYSGAKATVRASGEKGSALDAAERLVNDHLLPAKPEVRDTLTCRIPTDARAADVKRLLADAGAEELPPTNPYEMRRMRLTVGASNATAVFYSSKKCVVQGNAPAFDQVVAALEQALGGLGGLGEDRVAKKPASAPPELPNEPRIGTDESGKGDYFGPLVSAAVFVTPQIVERLSELGVRDSKRLSDNSVRKIAGQLRSLLGERNYAIVPLRPETYNRLYAQFRNEGKNLNTLLAWGHARSIENLLERGIKPRFAVVDQFADKSYIERKILEDTRESGLEIKQFPKAEADLAVAAASILARDAFLEWLERESRVLGITLPKGASPQVVEAARAIVERYGRERLGSVAKLAFKTTEKVLA